MGRNLTDQAPLRQLSVRHPEKRKARRFLQEIIKTHRSITILYESPNGNGSGSASATSSSRRASAQASRSRRAPSSLRTQGPADVVRSARKRKGHLWRRGRRRLSWRGPANWNQTSRGRPGRSLFYDNTNPADVQVPRRHQRRRHAATEITNAGYTTRATAALQELLYVGALLPCSASTSVIAS